MRFALWLVVVSLAASGCTKVTLQHPPAPRAPESVAAAVSKPTIVTHPAAPAIPAAPVPVEDASPAVPPPPPASRLGVLVPLSGRYAPYGKAYLEGARAAADEFNAKGPRRVDLVPADAKSEPLAVVSTTRRLVRDEKVVAILGSVLAVPTVVAAMEANCHGVPLLSNVATEDELGGIGPYVFHAVPSRRAAARAGADLAVLRMRKFRAAILYPEEGDGRALALAFSERFAALGGEVVLSEPFASGTNDFTPVARRVAESQAELLYAPADADALLLLLPALAFHAVHAQLMGSEDLGAERVLKAAAADLEGAVLPAPDTQAESAPARRADRVPRTPTEERLAAAGYAGARRLLDAIAQTQTADPDAVQQALRDRAAADSSRAAAPQRFLVVHNGHTAPLQIP